LLLDCHARIIDAGYNDSWLAMTVRWKDCGLWRCEASS